MKKILICFILSFSLFFVCTGCSSEGRVVPEDIIGTELGEIANKADIVTYKHNFDNNTKIDTVTVNVTYDNEYCKSVGSSIYQYQHLKSDGIWNLISDGNWEWDEHLKDFSEEETKIEAFSDSDGYSPAENEDFYYFNLDIMPGSINTASNTFQCAYVVEFYKYNNTLGYHEPSYRYSSDGYECIPANILPGGAVCVDLKDPSTNRSTRFWFNSESYINVNLFV